MALCANWDIPASLLNVGSAAVQSERMLHKYSCWVAEGGNLVQISCSSELGKLSRDKLFLCFGLIVWSSIFV